jgi:hypothetical protein
VVRLAIVAPAETAALHGLDGDFEWGTAGTFASAEGVSEFAPDTVIALGTEPPAGAWRTIAWGAPGARRVGTGGEGVWRRAPLPAADALAALRKRPGAGVLVVGGDEPARESAVVKLRARGVEVRAAARLAAEDLERAAVVALLGEPGEPLPDAAPAVLAAGRLLIAPRSQPAFGLLPWNDHLPYDNEDELACSADAAFSFPAAFEPQLALGALAAEAHLASAVYGRLAIDAELEDAAA